MLSQTLGASTADMLPIWAIALAAMPWLAVGNVTVFLNEVKPLPLSTTGAVGSATELFRKSCPEESAPENPYSPPELLMSSYAGFGAHSDSFQVDGTVHASSDSLVRGAIDAWAQHQHLVLRPDEIWFEILAQLNFYMSAHAEDIRHLFVDHDGKKEIKVLDFTWRDIIARFASEIQQRVRTEWLLEWIMPGFSTSTADDGMTATVLMMGLMQQYFEFTGNIICGLPSVTLLGERADWVRLLDKLDRLDEWGEEPKAYAENLRPILSRFVRTWDEPEKPAIKSFWTQIVRAHKKWTCGSGAMEFDISGWITGFLHWKADGSLRILPESNEFSSDHTVSFDGITYSPESLEDVPVGYAKAPLKMLDYPSQGEVTHAYVLAGNIGVKRAAGADYDGIIAQPLSAWFMYAPVEANCTVSPWHGSGDELERIADGFYACGLKDD